MTSSVRAYGSSAAVVAVCNTESATRESTRQVFCKTRFIGNSARSGWTLAVTGNPEHTPSRTALPASAKSILVQPVVRFERLVHTNCEAHDQTTVLFLAAQTVYSGRDEKEPRMTRI